MTSQTIYYANLRSIPMEEREERLNNLRNYKYVAVDKSLLSNYVLNRLWELVVSLFPRRLAPNLITVFGFIFIVFACAVNVYYDYEMVGAAPSFVYYTNAVCLFIYMMFDAVDGKQARRTKTGSPLGQLFDHGIDSLVATLTVIMFTSSLGFGRSLESFLFLASSKLIFYFVSFEEYFTHKFVLSYINGPTEGILSGILVFLVSAIFKPSCWSWLLRNDLSSHVSNISLLGLFFIVVVPLSGVISSIRGIKTGDKLTVLLQALVPIIFYTCFYIYFRQLKNTFNFYVLMLTEAFNFLILIVEMSYAHLTRRDIPIAWPSVTMFAFCVYFTYRDIYLYGLFLFAFISACLIVFGIINEICDALQIGCFTIRNEELMNKKN
ncbi:sn-1,2-diacylglycerol ethanolamine- and cholinephosphotransferase [Trachipleistophora hominis]|uniref:sn-1,2-diacylglycerol ethanolamine-and cholinephosphotransferase n=1 Tax=Trachipleistophora hominis TaxID=72359 RepID=L7JU83_TRAHO|nr:sn-1,2-diacylglycerol ethanolamine- and cholinephosphotransferase [Trachipleistophora hominis]